MLLVLLLIEMGYLILNLTYEERLEGKTNKLLTRKSPANDYVSSFKRD